MDGKLTNPTGSDNAGDWSLMAAFPTLRRLNLANLDFEFGQAIYVNGSYLPADWRLELEHYVDPNRELSVGFADGEYVVVWKGVPGDDRDEVSSFIPLADPDCLERLAEALKPPRD